MKRPRKQDEHALQSEFVATAFMLRHTYPEVDLLFAIPNGGWRDPVTAAKLKAEGVRAGVPDVCLAVARGQWHALYIEFKTEAGHLSEPQAAWHRKLHAAGNLVVVARSVHEGLEAIRHYLAEQPAGIGHDYSNL